MTPQDRMVPRAKAQAAWERFMSYQLVGEVTAHQGDNGYRA